MILTTHKSAVIILGVCAQIILTTLFLWRFEPSVENKLLSQSRQQLQQANMSWARVSADGRDLEVSGMAPSQSLKDQALQIVNDVNGVRIVTDKLLVTHTVSTPQDTEELNRRAQELLEDIEDTAPIFAVDLPYEIHMEVGAGVITMSGLVPDEVAKKSVLNLANREFGEGRLIDRLITSPGAPDGYLTAVTHAITAAGDLSQGLVGVNKGQVFVQGVLRGNASSESVLSELEAGLPQGYQASVQAGDKSALDDLLRSHPNLAARIGNYDSRSRDETVIETVKSQTPVEDTAQNIDGMDCANRFDQALKQQSIGFETASSDIRGDSAEILDNLVAIAKMCPQSLIEIAGHTDDQGSQQNNLSLSQRRAEAVMEYLVKNGVTLRRLSAVGYGEDQPLVPNTDLVNREINRRIEFRINNENNR